MSTKIRMEKLWPYNGLTWMVAKDEGLFDREGLDVEFVDHGISIGTDVTIQDWDLVSSLRGHGEAVERGAANIFTACEWGNYRRAQDTAQGALQLDRRAEIACGAIVVPPWSEVYVPQQLANKKIAVPFHAGTHYLCLQLLEGFVPREMIKVVSSGMRPTRFRSMMEGVVDACTLVEPWITVAETNGCRIIGQAFYVGTHVATNEINPETQAAIRGCIKEAVHIINADKAKYVHYFIDCENAPEVKQLRVEDFNLARLVYVEPSPIPEVEFQRTYEWMVSWNLIKPGHCIEDLVNKDGVITEQKTL